MPTDHTYFLIQRLFEEAFNRGNLAAVDDVLSSDHFAHNAFGGTPHGPAGLKWLIATLRTAFPDLHCTVDDQISDGEKFAAHWTMRGTHHGLFMGSQPSGKRVTVPGIIFGRLIDGRLAEDWTLIDQLGLLQQLGIVPPQRIG
ncbi:MAG: ester cyclase [Candidatus Promineifilaceae bacterium]